MMVDLAAAFLSPHYRAINDARIAHLDSIVERLGLAGRNLRVLELGAGIGSFTDYWLSRGFRVTATDSRSENLTALRRRCPCAETRLIDLDNDAPPDETFDIVHAYGVLYHLGDPARGLSFMSACCSGILFLETCVSTGTDLAINPIQEPADDPTQAQHGVGCRPTRGWVFEELSQRFQHLYQPSTQPDHDQFPTDWLDPAVAGMELKRTTFVASREPLSANFLFASLLDQQIHARSLQPVSPEGIHGIIRRAQIDCIIDVGANAGQFAGNLRRAGYQGQIVSFEPLSDASRRLADAASTDRLWTTHQLALSDAPGVAKINISANSWSSSLLPLHPRTVAAESTVAYVKTEVVTTGTLDALWDNIAGQHLRLMLKLDVQGSELAVLKGATNHLDRIDLILSECSLVPLYHGETLAEDLIGWLRQRGFHPVWLGAGFANPSTEQIYQCDIMFARTADLGGPC